MSLFVCAKCGCVDNTATSSYWMLTNEYMVDEFDYAKELQPYKGMGLPLDWKSREYANDLLDHYSTFPTSLILFLSR